MAPELLSIAAGPEWLTRAADHLRTGRVVALPTETVYGLACCAFRQEGVERLFELKSRSEMKPLPVQVDSLRTALAAGFTFSPAVLRLARTFWPGPVTLVLERPASIPSWYAPESEAVALRIPDHAAALALLAEMGDPLAVTSANRSGEPPLTEAAAIAEAFRGEEDLLILDDGPSPRGLASTVMDVTGPGEPRLVREGPVSLETLLAVWRGSGA